MARYIDADKAFNLIKEQKGKETGAFSKGLNKGLHIAMSTINNKEVLPTADVVEVKHGYWLTKEYEYGKDGKSDEWVEKLAEQGDCAYCSFCLQNAGLNGGEEYVLSNYCPNCGAKMDGKPQKEG